MRGDRPPTTGKDMLVIGLPRMRGDRPSTHGLPPLFPTFTPHARGSTLNPIPCFLETTVYPACAGIDPRAKSRGIFERSLPRMRGDRPRIVYWYDEKTGFTRWGGGIDPRLYRTYKEAHCLPRMRGDRPPANRNSGRRRMFTPHARGSTFKWKAFSGNHRVYPACAGIDPLDTFALWCYTSLPRMRGDRPAAGCTRL